MYQRSFASRRVLSLLTFIVVSVAPTGAQSAAVRRTRTSDAIIQQTIEHACVASATFRRLVESIEASDIIVYIERQPLRTQGLVGMTRFVVHAGSARYIRVGIDWTLFGREAVAVLGHELQHVVEIAEAAWVVDRSSTEALFQSIGHEASDVPQRYDTRAAVISGRKVWQELRMSSHADAGFKR